MLLLLLMIIFCLDFTYPMIECFILDRLHLLNLLDATTHLYKRSCPSVRRSVGPSVPRYFRRWTVRILGASCAVYPALFFFKFTGAKLLRSLEHYFAHDSGNKRHFDFSAETWFCGDDRKHIEQKNEHVRTGFQWNFKFNVSNRVHLSLCLSFCPSQVFLRVERQQQQQQQRPRYLWKRSLGVVSWRSLRNYRQ